jgi:hypothetical protein
MSAQHHHAVTSNSRVAAKLRHEVHSPADARAPVRRRPFGRARTASSLAPGSASVRGWSVNRCAARCVKATKANGQE